MKFKTKIKKILFLTEENKKIEVELSEEAPYFIEFNLLDEDKEKVKLEKNICLDCIHGTKVLADEYPCVRCIHNPWEYCNPNLKREIDLFHNKKELEQ